MKPIFKLSWQFIKYYRAQALSILFSIIISVALTVDISSLVYSGELSNTENQRELYGDYHYLIYAEPDMIQSIENNKVSENYTLERIGKYTIKGGTEESANLVFANVDNEYLSMTGRDVLDGSYPVEANEIALDDFSMRNLGVSGTIGDEILIGNETYILSGIISDAPATYSDSMLCFVSDQFRGSVDKNFLYLKFDESKNLKSEVTAFMEEYGLAAEQLQSNEHLNGCLFSGNLSQLIEKVKWVINEPDANFTTFLMTLRYEFKLTSNVIAAILCLFSIFIIYSIFNISVMKRMPQYGVMRTLGINNTKTFFTLLAELVMLFVVGYPIGSVLGGAVAKSIYSRAGKLFVGDGAIFQQAHSDSNVSGKIVANNVMQKFSLDKGSMIFSLIFLLILLLFVCFLVIRKINKVTIIQMMGKGTPDKKRKNRKIYCRKRADLKKVLTQKFMFDRKDVFLGIVISLSIGGILFLGTSFVVKNTELNNELTLKSDDGLHSDCQIYMDTAKFNEGIPPNILDKMQNVKGVQELHGAKYFLGEIPVKKELLAWKEYFPEIGNDPAWTQPAEIMSRFNGVCVETDML